MRPLLASARPLGSDRRRWAGMLSTASSLFCLEVSSNARIGKGSAGGHCLRGIDGEDTKFNARKGANQPYLLAVESERKTLHRAPTRTENEGGTYTHAGAVPTPYVTSCIVGCGCSNQNHYRVRSSPFWEKNCRVCLSHTHAHPGFGPASRCGVDYLPSSVCRQVVHDLPQGRAFSLHRGQGVLASGVIEAE